MNVHVKGSDVNPYDSLSLPTLKSRLDLAKADLDAAKATVALVETAIANKVAEAVKQARELADKDVGTIHVVVEGCDVKHNIPKRVEWDTSGLLGFATQLQKQGLDPYTVIKFELSISEKMWLALSPDVKKLAIGARTEKHGKPAIEITPTEAN